MDYAKARDFARRWLEAWNAHDVEAVLAHFAEDVTFTSPVAARILERSDGIVRGKVALRLAMASLAAVALRIAGYGAIGLAQNSPPLVILFYLLPLAGAAGAIAVLAGFSPAALLARWRGPDLTGAAA